MTTAERGYSDRRLSAFIRGYGISHNEPVSALFVVSSIGSFLNSYLFFLIIGRTIGLPRRLHANRFPY